MSSAARVNLAAAVERAARDLPEGYRVEIEVERGAATVRLWRPDDAYFVIDRGGDLVEEVCAAVVDAAADAKLHGGPSESGR